MDEKRCSFCDLPVEEVELLIAGPDEIYICDGCIELCVEMLSAKRKRDENKPESET